MVLSFLEVTDEGNTPEKRLGPLVAAGRWFYGAKSYLNLEL